MFKNFGLKKDEIAEIAIAKSHITKWTQRLLAVGIIFAVVQGAIYYGFEQKYARNIQLDKDIAKEHSNITKKLASIATLESKAKQVVHFRKNLHNTFMPTGVYYALSEAILPGMVFKNIVIEKGKLTKGDRDTLPANIREADYILTLSAGYDTPTMDLAPFIDTFDASLKRNYKDAVNRVGLHMQAGQVRAVKDALFTGQEITIGLNLKNKGTK